jgi:competence protein ComFC
LSLKNSFKNISNKINNKILDLFYPTDIKCIFCGNELLIKNRYCTCGKCFAKLPYLEKLQVCEFCGTPIDDIAPICGFCFENKPAFLKARASFEYNEKIKYIVNRFKYNDEKFLAKPLAEFMADEYFRNNFECDFILYTPLTLEKFQKRGYNQSELLANSLSQILDLPVKQNVHKIKNTLTQTNLNREERKINLEKAFKILKKKELRDKNILLVDDVFTTGATVQEISKLLLNSGAKAIYVLTLAHTYFYKYKD